MNYTSIIILIVLSFVFMVSARSPVRPPFCGRGGRYVQCASACDDSCQTLGRPKGFCATACHPGCRCDKGFVKTRHGGTCVPIRECRKHI